MAVSPPEAFLLSSALSGEVLLEAAAMALAFVALWWGVAWWLDRRKIYLKI